mgnify:FL=1
MDVALYTPLPGFANELWDVMKLFLPVGSLMVHPQDGAGGSIPQDSNMPDALLHRFWTDEGQDGLWHCAFAFRGHSASKSLAIPADIDEEHRDLVYKRLQKRLCKLTLYDLLKEMTGHHPPWGSLTGIRPTRLVYENMAAGMDLKTAAAALVRDFDLMPGKAELLRRIVAVQQTLPFPRTEEADVYVSIPFCRTRCTYCSFPGESLGKGCSPQIYLDALFAEMEASATLMKQAGIRARALYIGGGTPTALCEADFGRLMDRVCRTFPCLTECTVEAGRPDTITRGKLETLRAHGINRISVNPQTMNEATLRLIGRDHTPGQTKEAFALARSLGFDNINMDVIAGLPGETEEDFAHTLEEIIALNPDSLTVHTLAIKRSSRLNLEGAPLPPAPVAARMVELGEEAALRLDMEPYYLYRQKYMAGQQQNVGYAKAGKACLYNVDIMEENTSILALGAGAISKRVFPDRELRIERAPNISNVALYVQRVDEMVGRKRNLFGDAERL